MRLMPLFKYIYMKVKLSSGIALMALMLASCSVKARKCFKIRGPEYWYGA
jgi:hypothetical protein